MKAINTNDFSDEDIESLMQLDKEDLIRLFLKTKKLWKAASDKCDKLEEENLKFISLDKLFEEYL